MDFFFVREIGIKNPAAIPGIRYGGFGVDQVSGPSAVTVRLLPSLTAVTVPCRQVA